MAARSKIDTETIVEVYKTQWDDIHHSRNQDWELSRLILAGFLGISGLQAFTQAQLLLILLSGSFALLSLLAILITARHKRLFEEKMGAIRKLETAMGLDQLELFAPFKTFRLFTTQNFLIVIYMLSTIIFGTFLLLQLFT